MARETIWDDFFREGGAGMYPTAFVGILLVAAAVILAIRPERRFVPVVVCLGVWQLATGLFATSVGFLSFLHTASKVDPHRMPAILLEGLEEALHCSVLALCNLCSALFCGSIAAWRMSRSRLRTQAPGHRGDDADLRAAG